MPPPEDQKNLLTAPWYRWILPVFLGVIASLIALAFILDIPPVKAGLLFFPLVWIPLVFLHEFGHAAMTKICGWKADKFVIGFGAILAKFHIGRTRVVLHALPIEGFVMSRPYPGNLRFPRLKLSLIYAAGPGIELLLALILYLSIGPALLAASDDTGIILAQSVCLVIIIGVIINLIPLSPPGVWSDGQGIVMSWLIPHQWFKIWSRGEEIDLDSAATAPSKPRVRRPN